MRPSVESILSQSHLIGDFGAHLFVAEVKMTDGSVRKLKTKREVVSIEDANRIINGPSEELFWLVGKDMSEFSMRLSFK